jgi:hypothetical protein
VGIFGGFIFAWGFIWRNVDFLGFFERSAESPNAFAQAIAQVRQAPTKHNKQDEENDHQLSEP